MKKNITLFCLLTAFISSAQDLPKRIELPPPGIDPSQRFDLLHASNPEEDKFSFVYTQPLYGSVVRKEEFIRDTGGIVYFDDKYREPVMNSGGAVLVVKHTIDREGKLLSDQLWLLAQRPIDQPGGYKFYFRKNVRHPIIQDGAEIRHTLVNLDNVEGLSNDELTSLVNLAKRMMPAVQITDRQYREKTIAEDIQDTKNQLRSLRQGGMIKGDLPRSEQVLTRYSIRDDRNIAITKTKGKQPLLKFYLTEDYKHYELVDSAQVEGDVQLTSVATIYNAHSEPAGAFANMLLETKNEKGESVSMQLSYILDASYNVTGWKHSVGKNKLNSLKPKVCWYEGNKTIVLSENNEKFFKSYKQVHLFQKGSDALMTYPHTEEEKGTEKFQYVKSFQPQGPVGAAPPVASSEFAIAISSIDGARYAITEGSRFDQTTNLREYLSVNIYRIDENAKVTTVENIPDYRAQQPVRADRIIKTSTSDYILLFYPVKLQLALNKEKSELSPLDTGTEILVSGIDGNFVTRGVDGSMLVHRSAAGNKYTLLFYPKQ